MAGPGGTGEGQPFVHVVVVVFQNRQRRHPHVIFEARNKVKEMCSNTDMREWGLNKYRKVRSTSTASSSSSSSSFGFGSSANTSSSSSAAARSKRDVTTEIKYVETALVLDKAMVGAHGEKQKTVEVHSLPLFFLCFFFGGDLRAVREEERQPAHRSRPGRHPDRQHRRPGADSLNFIEFTFVPKKKFF